MAGNTLLPQQILPPTAPLGKVGKDGLVLIDKNWWLLLYNLVQNSIGSSLSNDGLQTLESTDIDIATTDQDFARMVNNALELLEPEEPRMTRLSDLIGLADPDPPARAQPVKSITVGASPFTYTAPFDGTLLVTGGTVSAIALSRDGGTTFISIGLTSGLVPVSRLDQVKVTYSVLPTETFIPR